MPVHYLSRRHPDWSTLTTRLPLYRSLTACISSIVSKQPTTYAVLNVSPLLCRMPPGMSLRRNNSRQ